MNNLPQKIFDLESFQDLLKDITVISVRSNLVGLTVPTAEQVNIDWKEALLFASILAGSKNAYHQDAALRIAQTCISSADVSIELKEGAAVIFHMLANQLGLKLAIQKDFVNEKVFDALPLPLKIDSTKRDIEYTVYTLDGKKVAFNKFQKGVYDQSRKNDYVSVSAPTSAGKSFVMMHVIYDVVTSCLRKGDVRKMIVYIAPTRALIGQIERQMRERFIDYGDTVIITSVPQKIETEKTIVYVLTQERLHWLLNEDPQLKVHLLFVDEAHKISDPTRGLLLHQTIEDVISRSPAVKVMFSSPFSENPQELFKILPFNQDNDSKKGIVNDEYVAVNQNIILAHRVPRKPKEYRCELLRPFGKPLLLGDVFLEEMPQGANNVAYVAYALGKVSKGNLIYANDASTAEKWSQLLFDMRKNDNLEVTDKVREFIKLVKKVVHKDYKLVEMLSRRIAFHYGNMPQIIREGIEQLFDDGEIDFLICTATLLEGVNLPAKSIFIKKPQRGRGKDMSAADFWNLAGRAGRWGKEFQGNVVCVEPDAWEPPTTRTKQAIQLAKDLSALKINEVLDYIRADMPREEVREKGDLEYFFCYCFKHYIEKGTLPDLSMDDSKKIDLENECQRIKESLSLPQSIVVRNPGISPIAEQNLFNYFMSHDQDGKTMEDLLPPYPDEENAWESYLRIIQRISTYLSGKHYLSPKYRAVLVVNWMRGYTLARIIHDNWDYWQNAKEVKKAKNLPAVIRETMEHVENYVRFEFVKYSACYIDILRYALNKKGMKELADSIPQLHIWLELGVNRKTQISLIDLGLSRNTAIELSTIIAGEKMDTEQCTDWLSTFDVNHFDAPLMMVEEVKRVQKDILRAKEIQRRSIDNGVQESHF